MYLLKSISKLKYFAGLWIGLVFILIHLFTSYSDLNGQVTGNQYFFTPFTEWIGFNTNAWTILYYAALPLLCALTFNLMSSDDLKSGFLWHVITKTGLQRYLSKQYCVTVIGGFITAALPLLLDFLGLAVFLPIIKPDVILNSNLFVSPSTTYFSQLFYQHPFQLMLIYCLLAGLLGSCYAVLALTVAIWTNKQFPAIATGFILTLCCNVLAASFPKMFFSPILIVIGVSPIIIPSFYWLVGLLLTTLIVTFIRHYLGGQRLVNH